MSEVCSMDGAVIPKQCEGEFNGESRRGVEGIKAGTNSIGPGYRSHREVGWAGWYRWQNRGRATETSALRSGAAKDSGCSAGSMGKGEADTREEGRVVKVQPDLRRQKESERFPRSLYCSVERACFW